MLTRKDDHFSGWVCNAGVSPAGQTKCTLVTGRRDVGVTECLRFLHSVPSVSVIAGFITAGITLAESLIHGTIATDASAVQFVVIKIEIQSGSAVRRSMFVATPVSCIVCLSERSMITVISIMIMTVARSARGQRSRKNYAQNGAKKLRSIFLHSHLQQLS